MAIFWRHVGDREQCAFRPDKGARESHRLVRPQQLEIMPFWKKRSGKRKLGKRKVLREQKHLPFSGLSPSATNEDDDCQHRVVGKRWAYLHEHKGQSRSLKASTSAENKTGGVVGESESPQRPFPANEPVFAQGDGREPVWRKRIRVTRASIDQEAHPFDESDNEPGSKSSLTQRSRSSSESIYSAPLLISSPPQNKVIRAKSEVGPRAGGSAKGTLHAPLFFRVGSAESDPFQNIDGEDIFSVKTPSVGPSLEPSLSLSETSSTDADMSSSSSSSSYSEFQSDEAEKGFGIDALIDAIGRCHVTDPSTVADEVSIIADYVAYDTTCTRCGVTRVS